MLDWIPMFFGKATAFVPRFTKVPPTDRLIKWSKCGDSSLHGPGLIWHWPLVTEVVQVDIRWQSLVTHVQTVTLSDGTTVSARTLTRWKPSDPLLAIDSEADYSDAVADMAAATLVDLLSSIDKNVLRQTKVLSTALTLELQSELRSLGVSVQKATFTELCITPAFRIISEN